MLNIKDKIKNNLIYIVCIFVIYISYAIIFSLSYKFNIMPFVSFIYLEILLIILNIMDWRITNICLSYNAGIVGNPIMRNIIKNKCYSLFIKLFMVLLFIIIFRIFIKTIYPNLYFQTLFSLNVFYIFVLIYNLIGYFKIKINNIGEIK